MSEKFTVEVVTPKGVLLQKEVEEVVAPGVLGEFGVLIGHTPMLTFIKPGVLSYLENDRFTKFVVGTGFCEVLRDSVTVLVDEAYSAEEIDSAKAAQEVSDLERDLEGIDSATDPEQYEKTSTRLKVARAKVVLKSGISA
ncbi:MAG: ATP synthase F1 subunit epsilon [Desulfomonilaceae bacterium]|nr:ATP synthase F1 subunit epsilon [Desulfomonilaceae bacterium]